MVLIPYRLDVGLPTLPILTLLVCLVCLVTFVSQRDSNADFNNRLHYYCAQHLSPNLRAIVDHVEDDDVQAGCKNVFMAIRRAPDRDAVIGRLSTEITNLDFYPDRAQDIRYKDGAIRSGFAAFEIAVPNQLTQRLAYRPDAYNVVEMVTSTFAHASWSHLLGNLVFFFIFASCVECLLGPLHFTLAFAVMTVATSVAYSHSTAGSVALPTIGLSGVAMGMMAMATVLLPTASIRCVFWFLLYIRQVSIPILVIAAWHVGWNVYEMRHDDASNINYVAHVSGAITGGLLAVAYRLFAAKRLEAATLDVAP